MNCISGTIQHADKIKLPLNIRQLNEDL
jgi:hypothetical protein